MGPRATARVREHEKDLAIFGTRIEGFSDALLLRVLETEKCPVGPLSQSGFLCFGGGVEREVRGAVYGIWHVSEVRLSKAW